MARAAGRDATLERYPDQQGPDRLVKTYDDPEAPEIFVDGNVEFLLSGPITRVVLYRIVRVVPASLGQKLVEHRTVALKIILPTNSAIELAQTLLKGLHDQNDSLIVGVEALLTSIKNVKNSVQIAEQEEP